MTLSVARPGRMSNKHQTLHSTKIDNTLCRERADDKVMPTSSLKIGRDESLLQNKCFSHHDISEPITALNIVVYISIQSYFTSQLKRHFIFEIFATENGGEEKGTDLKIGSTEVLFIPPHAYFAYSCTYRFYRIVTGTRFSQGMPT